LLDKGRASAYSTNAGRLIGWALSRPDDNSETLFSSFVLKQVTEGKRMSLLCHEAGDYFDAMCDEEVVPFARSGHRTATEHLMSKYRGLVESKARSYYLIGADHEDVVQEGMIGLFKAIRDYRGDRLSRFRAFAELCVTRQIITAIKMASRQKHVPLNGYLSLNYSSNDPDGDASLLDFIPDERAKDPASILIERRDERALQSDVVGALSSLEANVLQRYMEGKSYREMSVELHCRTKCIDNALQRVKRKLGILLEHRHVNLV
jgi:RNA polymerase sporulation-specific sigma factor